MHKVKTISQEISTNMVRCLGEIDEKKIEKVLDEVLRAKRIFVLGMGHSGLIGKIFAMKLVHLGFSSHVVGDVTTPSLKRGDLLVAVSQSGETSTILTLAKKAKSLGGKVVGVTSFAASTLGDLADTSLVVAARTEEGEFPVFSLLGDEEHKNMSGALFGINIFALFYGLVCELAARTGQSPERIDSRHANIE